MNTVERQRSDGTGLRAWSRKRWLVLTAVLIAVIVAVALLLIYGGTGSGAGGSY